MIEGEPGIGKTSLLRAGLQETQPFLEVLRCRATRSESTLDYVGLADLSAGLAGENLDGLSEPQQAALEAAVQRRQAVGPGEVASTSGPTRCLEQAPDLGVRRAGASLPGCPHD